MIVHTQVFNAYVRYMRKTAYAYNRSNMFHQLNRRRRDHWMCEYFRYAKIVINLAHQLPQDQLINFERFVIYDKTKNKAAFAGTLEEARNLS